MNSFKVLFILILAFIAFSVETDVYVPSFPEMVKTLGIAETSIQRILSLNFLGICISCLFSGPLSDRFGRKQVLSFGTGLFAIASLPCFLSTQFEVILLGRFIQGLGAGSILAVGCSCVFDLYSPSKSGQLVAILNAVITVTMSFAPLMGVWLNSEFGWRSSFLFIFFLATFSWLGIVFFLPETLPPEKRQPFSLQAILKNYLQLIKNRNFILGSFTWCLMFAALTVYTANVSLLFIEHFKVSEASFGFYQSVTMGSFGFFSLICSYLIGRCGGSLVKKWGTSSFFLGMAGLLLIQFYNSSSPLLISIAMAMIAGGTALAGVIYFTDSMVGITSAGAALSFVQGLRLFLSSELTDISRIIFNGSLSSITIVLFGIALLTLGCIYYIPKAEPSAENTTEQTPAII